MKQLSLKKKIEIVVQMPILQKVLDRLKAHDATRYTVLKAVSGAGHFGEWYVDQLSDATRHVMVVVIVGEDVSESIVDSVGELFTDYHGILCVSDVQVRRSEYF